MATPSSLATADCSLAAPAAVCALALVPVVLWGFTPVVMKYAFSRGGDPLQALVVVLAVDTGVLWVATGVLHGFGGVLDLSPAALGMFALAGLLGTAIGRIVVYVGIDRLGAAVNTACLSTRPLFATALGVVVLQERVGLLTLVGVVVLAVGLLVLSLSKGGDIRGWRPRDLLFPLAGAALFATASVVRRTGLGGTSAAPLEAVAINELFALFVVVGYVVARGRTDELVGPRITYPLFAVVGVLTATGMVAVFTALGHPGGRVVIVDPLLASKPLLTTAFAYVLLSDVERITRGTVAGATAIVAGAVLVILA